VCRDFLRNRGVPSSELTAEELLSEIWQKLLGTVSVGAGETIDLCSGDLTQVSIDPDVPERDGRVVWLVEEIGGAMAIAHRREDILRARFGRASTGNGRPLVQPQGDSVFTDIASDADAAGTLEAADGRRVCRGLLAMIALEFAPSDDLSMLLRLLSEQPGLLQDSPGGQWPITDIVNQLDKRFAPPAWTSAEPCQAGFPPAPVSSIVPARSVQLPAPGLRDAALATVITPVAEPSTLSAGFGASSKSPTTVVSPGIVVDAATTCARVPILNCAWVSSFTTGGLPLIPNSSC
jgi:hypothetical protein